MVCSQQLSFMKIIKYNNYTVYPQIEAWASINLMPSYGIKKCFKLRGKKEGSNPQLDE